MDQGGELVRRMLGALNRLSAEEAVRLCEPEIELTTLFDRIGGPRFHGHRGVRDWFERIEQVWAFLEIRNWRVEELGDWVLVTGTARMRGRASPDVIDTTWACAGRVSGGRFARFGVYLSRGEAIAVVEAD
jgi:hypothetical protein